MVRIATEDTSLQISTENGSLLIESPFGPTLFPLIDRVEKNGEPVSLTWTHEKTSHEGPNATLQFSALEGKLRAESAWRAKSGQGPIQHSLVFTNHGESSLKIPVQPSLRIDLPLTPGLEHWWVEKGAGWASARESNSTPIAEGFKFEGHSTGYAPDSGEEMIPWMATHDTVGKGGLYFGVESSARLLMSVTAGQKVEVGAGLDPSGGEFFAKLEPGESLELPTAFVGFYEGDVDDGCNRLRRFVERHLRPKATGPYPPVINNSWGSQMEIDQVLAERMIADANELGCELFGVDAGWFKNLGNWHMDTTKFSSSLAEISDAARAKGLKFGLWMAWTQGAKSDEDPAPVSLALNHPEQQNWFARDYPSDWQQPMAFVGADVCCADSVARAWCLEQVLRVVKEAKLDMLEHDQRMVVSSCVRTNHGHTSHPTDVSLKATAGYYSVMDRVRAEHPHLLFESCVNGGRMVDYGSLQRCHYFSICDSYDPLNIRRTFHDTSYAIPPSMCEEYVAFHPGPTLGTFVKMLRSGMMGFFTIMCDTGKWTPEQRQAAARQVEIYKTWIRPLVNEGNLYHVSKRPDGVQWDGMQYFDPATGKGILFAFRGSDCPEHHAFPLKGLNPEKRYQLRFEDGSSPEREEHGEAMMTAGVSVELKEAGASELVLFEELKV